MMMYDVAVVTKESSASHNNKQIVYSASRCQGRYVDMVTEFLAFLLNFVFRYEGRLTDKLQTASFCCFFQILKI